MAIIILVMATAKDLGRVLMLIMETVELGIRSAQLRHGTRILCGNAVVFIDPHKGIHGSENNVIL